jgi:hypothetical protein
LRHACMRAPTRTRDPAMIDRASSRSGGATTSRSRRTPRRGRRPAGRRCRDRASRARAAARRRAGSRQQHPHDRLHRLAVRPGVDVGILLPEQPRDVEDDVASGRPCAGGADGEREVARRRVDAPAERGRRGGADRVAREDERRPAQRTTCERPAPWRPRTGRWSAAPSTTGRPPAPRTRGPPT